MSKNNICIIGLAKHFVDEICQKVSEKLEMFYANANKIVEFELLDIRRMEEVCGSQYVLQQENAIIRRLCTYENTVINIEYSNLNNQENLAYVKDNCLLIHLKLSKNRFVDELKKENLSRGASLISMDLFRDRDIICDNMADLTIDCETFYGDDLINKIIEKIYHYYE